MAKKGSKKAKKQGLPWPTGDWLNVLLLTCLYTVQGTIFGFLLLVPEIVRNGAYLAPAAGIACPSLALTLCALPYLLKPLWAPVVDCLYVESLGRYKSWLLLLHGGIVPLLAFLSFEVDSWAEAGDFRLYAVFTILLALAATQDTVVDKLGLSRLQPGNVGYLAVSNLVGLGLGRALVFTGTISAWQEGYSTADAMRLCAASILALTVLVCAVLREPATSSTSTLSLPAAYSAALQHATTDATIGKIFGAVLLLSAPMISENYYGAKMHELQTVPKYFSNLNWLCCPLAFLAPLLLARRLAFVRSLATCRKFWYLHVVTVVFLHTYMMGEAGPRMTVHHAKLMQGHGVQTHNDDNHYIHPYVRFLLIFAPTITVKYRICFWLLGMVVSTALSIMLPALMAACLLSFCARWVAQRQQLSGTYMAVFKSMCSLAYFVVGPLGGVITDMLSGPSYPGGLLRDAIAAGVRSVLPDRLHFMQPSLPVDGCHLVLVPAMLLAAVAMFGWQAKSMELLQNSFVVDAAPATGAASIPGQEKNKDS
eukprot:TRINITY_DN14267_c0_g1_i1.p1 TRINITY_DN14267_c0_g1~~TRINITY_DN14267_c0_g1_i1.p1  ORF type:complete len:563 (+),score=77.75 TRINITY_DN14267_c0_g1_i1:79-1689(+)